MPIPTAHELKLTTLESGLVQTGGAGEGPPAHRCRVQICI